MDYSDMALMRFLWKIKRIQLIYRWTDGMIKNGKNDISDNTQDRNSTENKL